MKDKKKSEFKKKRGARGTEIDPKTVQEIDSWLDRESFDAMSIEEQNELYMSWSPEQQQAFWTARGIKTEGMPPSMRESPYQRSTR